MSATHKPVGDPCQTCGLSAIQHRVSHNPKGEPCSECGLPKKNHRVQHVPDGDCGCSCGVPLANHMIRKSSSRKGRNRGSANDVYKPVSKRAFYVGIDGEGQGRKDHKYILLAASDEQGKRKWHIEKPEGRLSTVECLEFILRLPRNARLFSFSFNYDLTCILRDLPDDKLYRLFRPELRQRKGKESVKGPIPVKWGEYYLNLQGTKFSLRKAKKLVVIWDVFKFFGCKFTQALKDWKVGEAASIERMETMKDKRGEFDKESLNSIREYCFEECRYMAELARKLTEAHENMGLKLTGYYGAGSSGSAMLKVMNIGPKIRHESKEMRIPVASAFFGGRFENSVIGEVHGTVYNYDISSAYPYQLYHLPCLEHATWEWTNSEKDVYEAEQALVQYGLGKAPDDMVWAPFPFRTVDGSITFPKTSGGGWVWKDEYVQGAKLFNHVFFRQAYVLKRDCDCRPFERIAKFYLERLRLGKEAAGMVIKLGVNSCYGKLAQSIGVALFNSWIWAGMITSGCRAQILEMLGLHRGAWNLLMVATDGIYTRERIVTPIPKDTGTFTFDDGKTNKKPLGGWEEDRIDTGVFVARPGIYFPLSPTKEQIKKVRGRGVGKGVILENHAAIVKTWRDFGVQRDAKIANVTRFYGAKTCISRGGKPGSYEYTRSPRFGQWGTRPVEMSFDPMPKRARVNEDNETLALREIHSSYQSRAYDRALMSQEARELYLAALEASEQPDGGDFADYEIED